MSKKYKFIITLLIIILGILIGISLGLLSSTEISNASGGRFIYPNGMRASADIIIDTQTGVMYLWHSEYYKGGLTTMLDKEGKPLLFDGNFDD